LINRKLSNSTFGVDSEILGKIAEAIPSTAWELATKTACAAFEKCLAPLTEAASGIGRLIAAKFDRLTELEKINAAAAFAAAKAKIEESGAKAAGNIQPKVMVSALEGAALEPDDDFRELWADLIAQEITTGSVHPLRPRALSEMTPIDAGTLSDIYSGKGERAMFIRKRKVPSKEPAGTPTGTFTESESHGVLMALGLIRRESAVHWVLTAHGEAFIESVLWPGASIHRTKEASSPMHKQSNDD